MTNFEKETGKGFSQRQLKNRWDALKKEWKAWKKLKGEYTSLGWNPIKRTVDALDDWWESRLKVVPEAQKFRTSGIDPEFEGKLDQMFMGIVATGDKAWAPSSGTLRSDIFEDVMSIVENYSSDDSDDEREKKEILQRMECFNRLFVVASSSVQLYYEKYILKQPCMNSKQSGEERRKKKRRKRRREKKKEEKKEPKEEKKRGKKGRKGSWERGGGRCVLVVHLVGNRCKSSPEGVEKKRWGKYYLVDSGYPQMKGYLGPYRGQRYHLPDFRRGRPVSGKEEEDINWAYENNIDLEIMHGRESDDDDDDDDDGDDDGESNNSSGFEMELTRDAIASSLMNSL
ncbi:hypothetical protein GOBAR_AA04116 [Gossypium barbadense]|uniref:Myb/SANT-like domain-containing protein n=1 Tax=Gossypium barbadense TaxID=3634 RepID=A0A2P5YLI3_GOSBA|nr:hypothetical protein GOBAR_AA04116 [Gossypium barbadense]